MAKLDKLKVKMDGSGMTVIAIAKKSGIERATLYNRLKGRGEFTASEINGLSSTLRLTKSERDDIFLSESVN